jgi:hypothetical protein
MGPFFPSRVVFTICCFLQFSEFDNCSHIPYNVRMDRNKALVLAKKSAATEKSLAGLVIHQLCYIFELHPCDADEENQSAVCEWDL